MIAIQLDKEDFQEKYEKVLKNKRFPEAINKVEYLVNTKNKEVENMEEFKIKNLSKLFLINYAYTNGINIIYADKRKKFLDELYKSKLELKR